MAAMHHLRSLISATSVALMLPLFAACGGDDSESAPGGGSGPRCDAIQNLSNCTRFTGSAFQDNSAAGQNVKDNCETNGTWHPEGGECPTQDAIAKCTRGPGSVGESITVYYSTGAFAWNETDAKSDCGKDNPFVTLP